jgi:hypothetical protein
MSDTSVGPAQHLVKPVEQQEGPSTIRVDAQQANAADARKGRAGRRRSPSPKPGRRAIICPRTAPATAIWRPMSPMI